MEFATQRKPLLAGAAVVALMSMSACSVARDLLGDPAKDDPQDGYTTYLTEGGHNTEMDFGPDQTVLMSQYAQLQIKVQQLEQTLEKRDLAINKLTADLATERGRFEQESRERAQAQASTKEIHARTRALESQILTLSVQKAELDLELTTLRIAQLQQQLDGGPAVLEASTTPPAAPMGRGRL